MDIDINAKSPSVGIGYLSTDGLETPKPNGRTLLPLQSMVDGQSDYSLSPSQDTTILTNPFLWQTERLTSIPVPE